MGTDRKEVYVSLYSNPDFIIPSTINEIITFFESFKACVPKEYENKLELSVNPCCNSQLDCCIGYWRPESDEEFKQRKFKEQKVEKKEKEKRQKLFEELKKEFQ